MATATLERWNSIPILVAMSIGTDQGTWWADETFGSRLWILHQGGKIDAGMVQAVQDEIERCLAWLKADGLALEISVQAKQTGRNRIDYLVSLVRPDGTPEYMEGVWYGL